MPPYLRRMATWPLVGGTLIQSESRMLVEVTGRESPLRKLRKVDWSRWSQSTTNQPREPLEAEADWPPTSPQGSPHLD